MESGSRHLLPARGGQGKGRGLPGLVHVPTERSGRNVFLWGQVLQRLYSRTGSLWKFYSGVHLLLVLKAKRALLRVMDRVDGSRGHVLSGEA
jgi:hypothetical protein